MGCRIVLALLVLGGCDDLGPPLSASPASAPLFGYLDVTLSGDVASLGEVQEVTVGGVPAYDFRVSESSLTVRVQGAPMPGPADVVVVGSRRTSKGRGTFSYDAPATGVPLKWAVFGASLSQGTESLGIDEHTQLNGVSGRIARQAAIYLALPILHPRLAPPAHAKDFNLDCTRKEGAGLLDGVGQVLTDPATGLFDLRRGRLAWQTEIRNYAIGGAKLEAILRGGKGSVGVIEHIVEDPLLDPGDIVGPVSPSQIERIEALDPDVAFATDLLANDTDPAVVESEDVFPDKNTPLAEAEPRIIEIMQRLGKLHGQYFIANILDLTIVPNVGEVRARRIAAGKDTAASFDAKVAVVQQQVKDYNAALARAMAPYPNLHLIDFYAQVEAVRGTGIQIGKQTLSIVKMGGLLSFDFLHFSDTGYARYANLFIDDINRTLGAHIPSIDLASVLATDEAAPDKLRAYGFTCVP